MEDKKIETRTGFVRQVQPEKKFDSGHKVVNALLVQGKDENTKWTQIRAWNAMADKFTNEVKDNQKWEFKGNVKQEPSKDDPKKVYDVMDVQEAYQHTKEQIQGRIESVEHGETKNGKPVTKMFVLADQMEGGKQVTNPYNVELYGDRTDTAKGIEKGDRVEINDWVRNYQYNKDGEDKTSKTFQNPRNIEVVGKKKAQGVDMGA